MPHPSFSRTRAVFTVSIAILVCILTAGCPHRSPIWSPDGRRILLLAGSGDEDVDRPAGGLWLLEVGAAKPERIDPPAPRRPSGVDLAIKFLGAAWIDADSFVVLAAAMAGGEVKEGSETIWRRNIAKREWTAVAGPAPSADRTPRRQPVVILSRGRPVLVYATGNEAVAAVSLTDGKEMLRMEPAELVGPGPSDGFLVTRTANETGGLEVAAVGSDLKPLWSRPFSELSREIAARTGKKADEIVLNDTSTSVRMGRPTGSEVGVTLVFTDVSWREGVLGYFVRLSGKDGALLATATARGLIGRPGAVSEGEAGGSVWAVLPPAESGKEGVFIRSLALDGKGKGEQHEIPGLKKTSVYGYSLSPDGKTFAAIVSTGERFKLYLFPVGGSKLTGKPNEIEL